MVININESPEQLGINASALVAARLTEALKLNSVARLVLSTGSSQFETLNALLKEDVPWNKVEIFHLDEYIGLPLTHKASFRKYLLDRFIDKISPKAFYAVNTDSDVENLIAFLSAAIAEKDPDVGLIGIGVNGHVAFNDPPADFDTLNPYIVVSLDEACRRQQVDEGWFDSLSEVPPTAVTMTPLQILKCRTIISCVPHAVKATSVRNTLLNKVTEIVPATILKRHADWHLYLDRNSASAIIPLE